MDVAEELRERADDVSMRALHELLILRQKVDEANRLLDLLDQLPRIERGAGGMTLEAQLARTTINRVPAAAVERAIMAIRHDTFQGRYD